MIIRYFGGIYMYVYVYVNEFWWLIVCLEVCKLACTLTNKVHYTPLRAKQPYLKYEKKQLNYKFQLACVVWLVVTYVYLHTHTHTCTHKHTHTCIYLYIYNKWSIAFIRNYYLKCKTIKNMSVKEIKEF